ncbi:MULTISPECIES: hypothetical protein [Rhizobium]|uniref:Uncharacterized protein n=1 Tax=Rhizobium paranaense TaxID=1650438 RepID=A0A7W8XVY7_9HYPH|nr:MULTISPECIES: hypothetical protein [Rhizobium]MBB5576354.1 hypothetical protein [Rhizobium paranaense]PST62599.1 hypothetical protein C9E91_13765 [Rhizobium sp. SEMIA4064]
MAKTDWIANAVVVLMGLITVGGAVWLGLYLQGRGPIPPKQLSAEYIGPSDPLQDLQNTGTNISVSISSGGKPVPKIYIYRASLENTGHAPILPSDFFGDLKLSALPDWHIVAVGNSPWRGAQSVSVDWKRTSDNLYTASPTLLNSGDEIAISVYLTAKEDVETAAVLKGASAPIAFETRVANLPSISLKPNIIMEKAQPVAGGITVEIRNWGVWFFLVIFAIYFALHLFLLRRFASVSKLNYGYLVLIFIASIFSISAAEATTTYVFGPYAGLPDVPADGWLNIPPLALNFGLLLLFYLFPILRPQYLRSGP